MNFLPGKRVLLGVTGGIAAYKSAELTRLLVKAGADVRVVMTDGAKAFVTPLTYQALSGNPVHHELLDETAEAGMGHIELAKWADRILIAPASANFIARLRQGMASDLLSTLCLASSAPILVAPAMNQQMWSNAQTQENVASLEQRGIHILGPDIGDQACGDFGAGRMLEPADLLQHLNLSFSSQLLGGLNVMITAGPTREAIDAVRFISNRSSGKMGFAIASAAREAGANVTLVTGPVSLQTPEGITRINVETAEQMGQCVLDQLADQHILIGSAAVADYVPSNSFQGKLKKSSQQLSIELTPTLDIMREVGGMTDRPFTVGFAAETDNIKTYAQEKRRSKNMDMIAANQVGVPESGFEVDTNSLDIYWANGEQHLALAHKTKIARQLVEVISRQYRENQGDNA
ncbi:MAG: bifunctional phosphopantothenoylcysteine decarboxylase/phosphopantothenate--cysteine ligase CoaBC [Gammaproteobacteria bacterium]|nr:bifunctional phosphopantothenoylcysteine decarboxylase/phosphopantothenate--cysteine ligase CoaBC [Gammaproteobacteria bacterium]